MDPGNDHQWLLKPLLKTDGDLCNGVVVIAEYENVCQGQ